MFRNSSLILLLSVFILFSVACKSIYIIDQEELLRNDDNWIISVITHDDEHTRFAGLRAVWEPDPVTGESELMIVGDGARLLFYDVTGVLEDGTIVSIPIEEVWKVYVKKTDTGKTIYGCGSLLIVGSVVSFLLIGVLTYW